MTAAKDRLPIAPLLPFVRLAAIQAKELTEFTSPAWKTGTSSRRTGERGGVKQLCRLYAKRYDEPFDNVNRRLWRWLAGSSLTVDPYEADRWCVLMNLHPACVWPDEWREAA